MSPVTEPVETTTAVVARDVDAEWLYLAHPETGGSTRIPNDDAALESHTVRGWVLSDPPDTTGPGVPDPGGRPVEDAGAWVEMVHPGSGGRQLLPNNGPALAGAREAGWVTAAEAADAAVETEGLTVREVLEAVDGDPVKAAAALAAERAGKNRTSLISALEALAAPVAAAQSTAEPQNEEL